MYKEVISVSIVAFATAAHAQNPCMTGGCLAEMSDQNPCWDVDAQCQATPDRYTWSEGPPELATTATAAVIDQCRNPCGAEVCETFGQSWTSGFRFCVAIEAGATFKIGSSACPVGMELSGSQRREWCVNTETTQQVEAEICAMPGQRIEARILTEHIPIFITAVTIYRVQSTYTWDSTPEGYANGLCSTPPTTTSFCQTLFCGSTSKELTDTGIRLTADVVDVECPPEKSTSPVEEDCGGDPFGQLSDRRAPSPI